MISSKINFLPWIKFWGLFESSFAGFKLWEWFESNFVGFVK